MAHKSKRPQVAGSRNPVAAAAHQYNRKSVVPDKRAKHRVNAARHQLRGSDLLAA